MKKSWISGLTAALMLLALVLVPAAPARAETHVTPEAPVAGKLLYSGNTTNISWQNGMFTEKVDIYYSTDNQATFQLVHSGAIATPGLAQGIAWVVPDANSTQCYLKFHYYTNLLGEEEGEVIGDAFTIKNYRSPVNLVATADSSTSINLTWEDNGTDEDFYRIERKDPVTQTWDVIQGELPANTESYPDTGLAPATAYEYRVWGIKYDSAHTARYDGDVTNTASATTLAADPQSQLPPAAPTALTAVINPNGYVDLNWKDNSNNETGFDIYRQTESTGNMNLLVNVGPDTISYSDTNLAADTTFYYQVCATNANGSSQPSNAASVTVPGQSNHIQVDSYKVLKYYNGQMQYLVNDQTFMLDSPPVVMEDRILLPIKFVTDPLGGSTAWNPDTKQGTINCNGHVLVLALNSNTATLDGMKVPIDPGNSAVMPVAQNNRILMPLRFVGESLDCAVQWNQLPQEAVITYPDPG